MNYESFSQRTNSEIERKKIRKKYEEEVENKF